MEEAVSSTMSKKRLWLYQRGLPLLINFVEVGQWCVYVHIGGVRVREVVFWNCTR